jgi:hypothetical protein
MKKLILAVMVLIVPVLGMADNHGTAIVEMWKCELKEGVKAEDVEATNKKWLALTRKTAGSDEVNSYMMTTVVGDQTKFLFADIFPDMAAWGAAKDADSEEGDAIEAAFNELMDCTDNRLYKSKQQ